MSNKDKYIENPIYYTFDYIINVKKIDLNNIKTDEKSHLLYWKCDNKRFEICKS